MYNAPFIAAVDLKSGEGKIYEGEPKEGKKAGCTLTLDDGNMVGLVKGKLKPALVRNEIKPKLKLRKA